MNSVRVKQNGCAVKCNILAGGDVPDGDTGCG